MTTLNSRLQLALLKQKKERNLLEKGFTLVELMIVIVIVGVLSATALPQFLGLKDKASIGSAIGEAVGLAKECSAIQIAEGPYTTDCPETATGNAYSFTSEAATDNSAGLACGPTKTLASGQTCSITVAGETGLITYTVA